LSTLNRADIDLLYGAFDRTCVGSLNRSSIRKSKIRESLFSAGRCSQGNAFAFSAFRADKLELPIVHSSSDRTLQSRVCRKLLIDVVGKGFKTIVSTITDSN